MNLYKICTQNNSLIISTQNLKKNIYILPQVTTDVNKNKTTNKNNKDNARYNIMLNHYKCKVLLYIYRYAYIN